MCNRPEMYLGKVLGPVWATAKEAGLSGRRLFVVQPVNAAGHPHGRAVVCADAVGAAAGSLVYYSRGREASLPFLPEEVPTDTTIVAIVDELHLEEPA